MAATMDMNTLLVSPIVGGLVNVEQRLIAVAIAIHERNGADRPFSGEEVVKDYIGHNERGLAFDMLVDLLIEYDIPLLTDEYTALKDLNTELGSSERNVWNYLERLIL